jgi:hypothetical protein
VISPDFDNPSRCCFVHHEVDVRLDPATAGLQATDRLTLVHAKDTPADLKTPFLLNSDLRISGITCVPALPIRWIDHERWEPRDFWDRPEYPELGGLDHARQVDLVLDTKQRGATWPETLLVIVRFEGTVYDSLKPPAAAYQRGFETSMGLIDPRGVFLAGGTLWHPHRFGQPFAFRVTTEIPADWEAVSQGEMTERRKPLAGGTTSSVTWDSPHPMEEIYLVAGPYVFRQEDHHGVAVQTFTYGDDDEDLCRRYIEATRGYLDLYGERIGPYPFAKFALVENFWQTGYGMPSFTLLGNRVIRLPFIVSTSYGHEILHNWWGNGVFVDWEQGNWCEGLTVYGADYLYKERDSQAAARDYRRTQLQGYLDYVRDGRDFPLTEFRARHDASSQAIGYGKAMMVVHMLRKRFGDDLFWKSLGEFYDRFIFKNASWTDLLRVFAETPGASLEGFHDEWIARAGAPLLRLAAASAIPHPDGGVELNLVLEQDEPTYRLEVPVRVTLRDGSEITLQVGLDGTRVEQRHHLPGMPQRLAVDPDFDLFRRLHRAEVPVALSQVMGADSIVAVIAEGMPDALRSAYEGMATGWRQGPGTGIVSDGQVSLAGLNDAGVWILGEPAWFDRLHALLPRGLEIDETAFSLDGQQYDRSTHTLVLALPHPDSPDEAIGVVLTADAQALEAIGRKIPHYGKYSYLVFEGARNVAKGSWTIEQSPLIVVWENGN